MKDGAYRIVPVSHLNISDINTPNQAFTIFGRIVPAFDGKKWTYTELLSDSPYDYTFPNDDLDYAGYIGNPDKAILFLYEGKECAGQIRIRSNWNGYCFIEDIAVAVKHRSRGCAKMLLDAAERWARTRGLKGFMLEAQDFNLGACRMYSKYGFVLGSADNMLYYNTGNRNVLALFWYKLF